MVDVSVECRLRGFYITKYINFSGGSVNIFSISSIEYHKTRDSGSGRDALRLEESEIVDKDRSTFDWHVLLTSKSCVSAYLIAKTALVK